LVLFIIVYTLFNKIRGKGKTVSAWSFGGRGDRKRAGGKGGGRGKGGEMTQTLYAHMNKRYIFKNWPMFVLFK
jgi:hypothetical protein